MQILIPIASAFLFALTFYFRKLAVKVLPIQLAYLLETAVQLVILSILFFVFPFEWKKYLDVQTHAPLYALLAGVFVTAGVLLNYQALQFGFLSKIIAIMSPSQIIFGVLIGMILAKETLSVQQVIGVVFGIVGIGLVVL
jgi:uncharacterized membrane protein